MDIEKLVEAVKLCGSTPKVNQCKQCYINAFNIECGFRGENPRWRR